MPIVAIAIDIQTFVEILSFRNKKPNKAVINGIADKQSRVIAAVVWVIDQSYKNEIVKKSNNSLKKNI